MSVEEQLGSVKEALEELNNDSSVPKNIKTKINEIINVLKESTETSIQVNKSLHLLEDVANDPNIKSYTRTQIWNIVSILEKV